MRGRTRLVAAGLATAAMTAALVPAQAQAAEGRPAIRWTACEGDGFPAETPADISLETALETPPQTALETPLETQCGTIDVPLDWAHPDERTTTLRVVRLPATDPAHRIGSVLHIPGGPGNSGIEDLKRAAGDLAGIRKRFDLVSFDPRNTDLAAKLPESCARPAAPALAEPRDRAAYDALTRAIAAAIRACQAEDRSGLYGRLDSVSVARDVDAIRAALGERRLSFMANSAGGVPAAAYLRLFPDRVRAMYLDGVVDQTAGWTNQSLLGYRDLQRIFDRFTAWCARTVACALHGEDAGKAWRDLTARADRAPIPVTSQQFGRGTLTGSHLRWFGFAPDPGPGDSRWLTFAEAVDKARRGDGSGFAEAALGNSAVWTMPLILGMTCGDDRGYHGYEEYVRARREARRISPDLGGATFDQLACAGWPLPVANPSRPLPVRGLPPLLGAGTWSDYSLTDSLVRRVPGSATVRYDGPGHVLYLSGNRCAIGHATRYLTDLTLPPPGTVCRPGD